MEINLSGYLESTTILDFVGAAFSRDRFNSRLESRSHSFLFLYPDVPDKRIHFYKIRNRF